MTSFLKKFFDLKSKSEINFHLNFDKINAEKELQKIYFKNKLLNPEISKNISQSENNSRTSEETSEINLKVKDQVKFNN